MSTSVDYTERIPDTVDLSTGGLKGRRREERRTDEHLLTGDTASIARVRDGRVVQVEVVAPPRSGANGQPFDHEYVHLS